LVTSVGHVVEKQQNISMRLHVQKCEGPKYKKKKKINKVEVFGNTVVTVEDA
jgi:hypothetical protein